MIFSSRVLWITVGAAIYGHGVSLMAQSQPTTLPDVPWNLTARPWQPVNQPRVELLDKITPMATTLATFQYWDAGNPAEFRNGQITDPYKGSEWQYATPFFAFIAATVLSDGRSPQLITPAIRAMDHATADIAGLDSPTADNGKANNDHGEFFIAPMVKALRLFKQMLAAGTFPELTPALIQKWETRLGAPRTGFMSLLYTHNWITYASKGDWLRAQDGLINKTEAVAWIENNWTSYFRARLTRDRFSLGQNPYLYTWHDDDPGTRQNFAYNAGAVGNLLDMIENGYDGASRADMEAILDFTSRTCLLMMAGSGDAPSSARTGNHVWNDIVYGNLFDRAAERAWRKGDTRLAGRFRRAAMLAMRSAWRYQQERGTFSVTKNNFHPGLGVHYAEWSALTNYNGYVGIHAAESYFNRQTVIPEAPTPAEIGGYATILDNQFAHSFLNAGGMQVQLCTIGATLSNPNNFSGGNLWHTLGILRFSRPGWDSRLGPGDGSSRPDLSQAISFSPTFFEGGVWKSVAQLPGRFIGTFTPEFTHPLIVRGTFRIAPRSGQTGPTFDLRLTITPDGVLVDTTRTGSEAFGMIWPIVTYDGKYTLNTTVGPRIATTAFPKLATSATVRPGEQATLTGGASVVNSGSVGANGNAYVTFPTAGGVAEWTSVNGGDGGAATVGFRYSLATAATPPRTMTLRVNGQASTITFPSTRTTGDWHEHFVPATLTAGATNTVRLESSGSGGVNLDELRVFPVVNAGPEPDQQAFIALDAAPVIDTSAATLRTAFGDQRPVRVTSGTSTQATFVYPRTAADPSAAAVQTSFARTSTGFTTALGRVTGDLYVGRTSAGGRGTGIDLDGDGTLDVTFNQACNFLIQLSNGQPIAIETDRVVTATIGGNTIALAAHSPITLSTDPSASVWQYRPLAVTGERAEVSFTFTPATANEERRIGVGVPGTNGPESLAAGVEFGADGRVTALDGSVGEFAYQAGITYGIRIVFDPIAGVYHLYIKPSDAPEFRLVSGAALPNGFGGLASLVSLAWFGPPAQAAPGPVTVVPYGQVVTRAINFQSPASPTPAGYLADTGAVFGNRGNGETYGWINGDASSATRDRDASNSPDQRYDTLTNMQLGDPTYETHLWEIALPPGTYVVRLVCGDPSFNDSNFNVLAEGVPLVTGAPAPNWREGTASITVTDGRLSLTNGPGSLRNKLCFIEITSAPTGNFPFQSYADWVTATFAGGVANPLSASHLDPDDDGLSNLEEYAFGRVPLTGDGRDTAVDFSSAGPQAFRFWRRAATSLDVTFNVWQSTGLTNWQRIWSSAEDADFTSPLVNIGDPAIDGWVTVTSPLPANEKRIFFRLETTSP